MSRKISNLYVLNAVSLLQHLSIWKSTWSSTQMRLPLFATIQVASISTRRERISRGIKNCMLKALSHTSATTKGVDSGFNESRVYTNTIGRTTKSRMLRSKKNSHRLKRLKSVNDENLISKI